VVPRPEIATVERRVAPSRSQRDAPRVANAVVAPRQRDRRPVRASRRSAHPSFGVGTRKQHDPRAERRAETRCDGMMEETEEDVRWKSEDRKNAKRSAGGLYQSTTVILRCERKRASKDERPVPCDGSRAVALRGPRFARAPQGDGHNRMRAA